MVIKRDSQEKDKKKIDKEGKKDFTKSKVPNKLIKNEDLLKMKEIWLEELRYRKTKLGKIGIRDKKIKNNRMFRDDEGMFYRKINNTKERQGTVPDIEKFVDFWAGILMGR